METAQCSLVLRHGTQIRQVDANRVRFSAHQCFRRDGDEADRQCLRILAAYLAGQKGLAVCIDGDGSFFQYILRHYPGLRQCVQCLIVESYSLDAQADFAGIPLALPDELPEGIETIFLCATRTYPRMCMRQWLPAGARLIEPDVLADLAPTALPARAWTPWAKDIIYPLSIPDFDFKPGMDLIVIDCPARNLGLMPNGLGYVHNALKQVDVKFQTCDLDILLYHRFHMRRLGDEGGKIHLASGRELPTDPWQAEHYDLWTGDEVIDYFEPEIQEIVTKLTAAKPKVLGLSIHGCNERFSARVVARVKAELPDIIILVGGYGCYSPDIGLRGFPLADYMCIGEADLTVGPLVERLASGERPANVPGVQSRFDAPARPFLPAPMVHDLDLLDHPRYDWADLQVYRNYNGYQLTPIIASRGCRWSRCTFCAERFYWRIRSPKDFVDELAWLVEQGCRLFMFNESDLNGKPEVVLEICDEIIRRGLKVKLTGQLRIHRKCDLAYFKKLRQAGFVALRFGVDAFSENTLRLQKKGYTTATVSQNLKDCWEAGIFSEVNWVIGVPGETEEDIDEGIALILKNKPYIGRLANINPLIVVTGGVYWMEPEKHNIHFRGDKEELYKKYPRAIPAHLWYSTEPYIDEKVRQARFERIVLALHEGEFNVGAWAKRVIDDVKRHRDPNRSGPDTVTPGAEKNNAAPAALVKKAKSAGIGGMEKPRAGAVEFNPDARSASYVFRAGSSLPEDATHTYRENLYIVSFKGDNYGVEASVLESAFGRRGHPRQAPGGLTLTAPRGFKVTLARTKDAVPELLESVGSYNIVAYDARFYGVPQQIPDELARSIQKQLWVNAPVLFGIKRPYVVRLLRRAARITIDWVLGFTRWRRPAPLPSIPWGNVDLDGMPGILCGANRDEICARAARLQGIVKAQPAPLDLAARMSANVKVRDDATKRKPQVVGSLEGYRIVEYEGWFYGIPATLGDVRLEDVDVIEMPGVIRDVAREVVEGEIREARQMTG